MPTPATPATPATPTATPRRARRNHATIVVQHGTARLEWTLLPTAPEAADYRAFGAWLIALGTQIRGLPDPTEE